MSGDYLDFALETAVAAARAAGEIALRYYRTGFDVTLKPDQTPVTQADREAERAIVEIVTRAFPSHGILGEEDGARGDQAVRWIIDPIDGTRNFVRRIPVWATLIALEEHGTVTVGVIHNPVTGELAAARRGGGAYLNGERLRVSDVDDLAAALLLHADLGLLRRTGHWDGYVRLVDATERQLLEMNLQGYRTAEIARELGLNADVLRVKLSRLRARLRAAGVAADWV